MKEAPPVVLAGSPPRQGLRGRTVLLALTCSERCRVVGLSRGARAVDAQKLRPGRPSLQPIELSAADAQVLGQGVDAALPLGVTVADPAGNRTTAAVTIRLAGVG